jgi:Ca-activated chloride channel family protein
MKLKVKTTILLAWMMGTLVILSGCSSVIDQIQKTTGNSVEQVETKVGGQAYHKSEPSGEEQQLAPIPATELKHILMDDGIGRYAGEKFDRSKVFEALSQIPKGMSSEKIYAYLLGLVGENYKVEDNYFTKFTPNYQSQVDLIKYQSKNPSSQSKKANVIVFLNITDSMGKVENGKNKLQEVKASLMKFASSLPDDANLSIGIFGHKEVVSSDATKCKSPEMIYNKQPYNAQKLQAALEQTYSAAEESSLSLAVRSTFQYIDTSAKNIVIIITDQADRCGGDPVREAEELHFSKQVSSFQVIGLDVTAKDEIELKQLATTAGGNFSKTSDQKEIEESLQSVQKEISQNNQPWQLVALSKITEAYQKDKSSLKDRYQGVVDKLNLEYERLVEANDYIKDLQKINSKEWSQMDQWIEARYKQVGKHMSDQLKKVDAKIDADWKNSVSKLEQDWKSEGKNVEEFNQYKENVMKSHSIAPESNVEVMTEQSGSINGSSE